jgi:hypothetical protein
MIKSFGTINVLIIIQSMTKTIINNFGTISVLIIIQSMINTMMNKFGTFNVLIIIQSMINSFGIVLLNLVTTLPKSTIALSRTLQVLSQFPKLGCAIISHPDQCTAQIGKSTMRMQHLDKLP